MRNDLRLAGYPGRRGAFCLPALTPPRRGDRDPIGAPRPDANEDSAADRAAEKARWELGWGVEIQRADLSGQAVTGSFFVSRWNPGPRFDLDPAGLRVRAFVRGWLPGRARYATAFGLHGGLELRVPVITSTHRVADLLFDLAYTASDAEPDDLSIEWASGKVTFEPDRALTAGLGVILVPSRRESSGRPGPKDRPERRWRVSTGLAIGRSDHTANLRARLNWVDDLVIAYDLPEDRLTIDGWTAEGSLRASSPWRFLGGRPWFELAYAPPVGQPDGDLAASVDTIRQSAIELTVAVEQKGRGAIRFGLDYTLGRGPGPWVLSPILGYEVTRFESRLGVRLDGLAADDERHHTAGGIGAALQLRVPLTAERRFRAEWLFGIGTVRYAGGRSSTDTRILGDPSGLTPEARVTYKPTHAEAARVGIWVSW